MLTLLSLTLLPSLISLFAQFWTALDLVSFEFMTFNFNVVISQDYLLGFVYNICVDAFQYFQDFILVSQLLTFSAVQFSRSVVRLFATP